LTTSERRLPVLPNLRARKFALRWIVIHALVGLFLAPTAYAQDPTQTGWRDRQRVSGDWGGLRSRIEDRGVSIFARYSAGFWTTSGGFAAGTTYEGFAEWGIRSNLERAVGWKGGGFDINWYSYQGGRPSTDLIGVFPSQTVSGREAAVSVRFYEILLLQTFSDGRLIVKAGQLAADTDFFQSEVADSLLNGTFGFLGLGREEAPFYPLAAPGIYFRARTRSQHWEFHVGVYAADIGEDVSENIGFGYSFDNGASILAEARFRRKPFGKRGHLALGFGGTTAEVLIYPSETPVQGAYGLWLMLDQWLLEQSDASPGLAVFFRSYGSPQSEKAISSWYIDFGFKLTRPIPGRDDDVFSAGFTLLDFGDQYLASELAKGNDLSPRESVLELSYLLQLTGWMKLEPNLQFFFDPHFSRRNAVAFGLRATVEL